MRRVKKAHVRYDFRPVVKGALQSIWNGGNEAAKAIFILGVAPFELERVLKEGLERRLDIGIDPSWIPERKQRLIEHELERLISYVLFSATGVHIVGKTYSENVAQEKLKGAEAICLFSGGVDSTASALVARKRYSALRAIYCAHRNQARVTSIVRGFTPFLMHHGIELCELPLPPIDTTGYSQMRGFLYVLSAIAMALVSGTNKIVIGECGSTMYQPQFGVTDQVTMTTHPFVLDRAQAIAEAVSAHPVIFETPFANMTKAEVMAACSDKRILRRAHSCVSQRLPTHDGTCYGCVIRRLAAIVVGIVDTKYRKNPLSDPNASRGNLLAVLEFSASFLLSRSSRPSHQLTLIEAYSKWGLFRRFALDNLAAVHLLVKRRKRLTAPVMAIYKRVAKHRGLRDQLNRRIRVLRARAR